MAAGSSPPPVASEKTSEGCRTTAANASPSSGALSPSTISTRRRSPRARPSVISLSPTAAMASRRKRLARPSRTSLPPGRTSHTSTARSKAGVAVSRRSTSGTRPRGRASSRIVRPSAARRASSRSGTDASSRGSRKRALSKASRGSRKKPSSPSSVIVRRAPARGGSVTRVFSFAMFGRRKSEPFSTIRRMLPSGASAVMSTRRTKRGRSVLRTSSQAPACGAVAGTVSAYDSRSRRGPEGRPDPAARPARARGSRALRRGHAEDEALVRERDRDQRHREPEQRRHAIEVVQLPQVVEEDLRDRDHEETEAHPAEPDAPPAHADGEQHERVDRPGERGGQVARRHPLEADVQHRPGRKPVGDREVDPDEDHDQRGKPRSERARRQAALIQSLALPAARADELARMEQRRGPEQRRRRHQVGVEEPVHDAKGRPRIVAEHRRVRDQTDGDGPEQREPEVLEPRVVQADPERGHRQALQRPADRDPLLLELERDGDGDEPHGDGGEPRDHANANGIALRPALARPHRGGERHQRQRDGQEADRAGPEAEQVEAPEGEEPGGGGERGPVPGEPIGAEAGAGEERPGGGEENGGPPPAKRRDLAGPAQRPRPARLHERGGERRPEHSRAGAQARRAERDQHAEGERRAMEEPERRGRGAGRRDTRHEPQR